MRITKSQLRKIVQEYGRAWGAHQPGYGVGNLTFSNVEDVLRDLRLTHLNANDIWEKYQDLNNSDDLRDALERDGLTEGRSAVKLTERQLRKIVRKAINEYGGMPQADVDAGSHAGAQRLAHTLQNDILRGARLFNLAGPLRSWGYETELTSAMGVHYIEVTDGPNLTGPLVIMHTSAAEPGPMDVVAGEFIVGKLS